MKKYKFKIGDEVTIKLDGEIIKGVITEDDKSGYMNYFVDMEDGHGSWFSGNELMYA